jgi:hypothetical protein
VTRESCADPEYDLLEIQRVLKAPEWEQMIVVELDIIEDDVDTLIDHLDPDSGVQQ